MEKELEPRQAGESLSSFSFYKRPATQVIYYKEATLADVHNCITSYNVAGKETEYLRELVAQMAEENDPVRKKQLKDQCSAWKRSKFNYCTFSGRFGENRKNEALQEHSRLLCLDLDHVVDLRIPQEEQERQKGELRSLLLSDEHLDANLLFDSPSGDGLKLVVEIDLSKGDHLTWFMAVSNYLKATYGLECDPACKNVSRACFLPYDPQCYIKKELVQYVEN